MQHPWGGQPENAQNPGRRGQGTRRARIGFEPRVHLKFDSASQSIMAEAAMS